MRVLTAPPTSGERSERSQAGGMAAGPPQPVRGVREPVTPHIDVATERDAGGHTRDDQPGGERDRAHPDDQEREDRHADGCHDADHDADGEPLLGSQWYIDQGGQPDSDHRDHRHDHHGEQHGGTLPVDAVERSSYRSPGTARVARGDRPIRAASNVQNGYHPVVQG